MATFENFTINGHNVTSLAINNKPVLIEKKAPLTIQVLKPFIDDDLMLEAQENRTSDQKTSFDVTCYNPSGTNIGTYHFDDVIQQSTQTNLISLLKGAGIDVDSMKAAGAKFEITNIYQWAHLDGMFNEEWRGATITGTTVGCFQLYGDLNKSTSKAADARQFYEYMFAYNPTIANVGISWTLDADPSRDDCSIAQMFCDCTSLETCIVTDEKGNTHECTFDIINASDVMSTYTPFYATFAGCSKMTIGPKLPARVVPPFVHYLMFQDCSNLSRAPQLPATTIMYKCYFNMFQNCNSISELHYSKAMENDDTFCSMEGSPYFGANNALIFFDL